MTGRTGAKRGVANLPLHGGKAPAWLFRRMIELAGAVACVIAREYGPHEMLRRLSDPFWFQAFGCVLGFDWHSSGVTTTVCGALKEARAKFGQDMGIIVCGGKGSVSRRTPREIDEACDRTGDDGRSLIHASRMSAKIDSAAVQDGYQLYHHAFFFVPSTPSRGESGPEVSSDEPSPQSSRVERPAPPWCVVQQGMNESNRYARRYHWLSESLSSMVSDPHAAVASEEKAVTLNLVAGEGDSNRAAMTQLSCQPPDAVLREIQALAVAEPLPLFDELLPAETVQSPPSAAGRGAGVAHLHLPPRHTIGPRDIAPSQLRKVLLETYERQPADFEALLGQPGVGPKTLRSLALLAEVIFNAPASRRDPAAYSFAHGGKDGHPFPVQTKIYDENIDRLKEAVNAAKLGHSERMDSLKRLSAWLRRMDG